MDSDQTPEIELGSEYVSLALRRSDGQSDSSSSSSSETHDDRAPSPHCLPPPNHMRCTTDPDTDSADSSTCELHPLLGEEVQMNRAGLDSSRVSFRQQQLLLARPFGLPAPVNIASVPRGNPEGCSESSSSSDCSILADV